ncbi:MAG: hypothetical protein ACRDPK_13470 [Carbonactinosporaceae bacterium]
MNGQSARQELHQLADQLDEPAAERVLRLAKSEPAMPEGSAQRPWPESIGTGHSGLGDVASNPEKYFAACFGR